MVDDGYAHITNIDVSVVVIQQMVEKHKEPKFANMKCKLFLLNSSRFKNGCEINGSIGERIVRLRDR